MRSTRAFIASIGVSACLVAAGALSLLALSAIVAIGGFPGMPDAAPPQAIVLAQQTAPVPGETPAGVGLASGALVLTDERQPERREPAAPTTAGGDGSPQSASAPRPAGSAPDLEPGMTPPSGGEPTGSTGSTSAERPTATAPQPGDPVRELGKDVSAPVHDLGKGLGDATGQLSPELGQTVQGLTDAVGNALRGTTELLGGTVDLLAP